MGGGATTESARMTLRSSGRGQNSTQEACLGAAATDANKGSASADFRDQRVVWIKVYVNTMEADGDVHMFCLKAGAAPPKTKKTVGVVFRVGTKL